MFSFMKKKAKPRQRISDALNNITPPDGEMLCRLFRYYPIGAKFQYYPEYKKEIVQESVVIAYQINGEMVYAVKEPSCEGNGIAFIEHGRHRIYRNIHDFKLVVPIINDSETKLDYVRREELARVGGMVAGNTVTIIGEKRRGQMPTLETIVDKRTILKGGVYANHNVALLSVNADTLVLNDQRAHVRLQTDVPAVVKIIKKDKERALSCKMVDFSDRALRISFAQEDLGEYKPSKGDRWVVSFILPSQENRTTLAGKVFRMNDGLAVIMLDGLVSGSRMEGLEQIDIVNIKANLLQHSQARISV